MCNKRNIINKTNLCPQPLLSLQTHIKLKGVPVSRIDRKRFSQTGGGPLSPPTQMSLGYLLGVPECLPVACVTRISPPSAPARVAPPSASLSQLRSPRTGRLARHQLDREGGGGNQRKGEKGRGERGKEEGGKSGEKGGEKRGINLPIMLFWRSDCETIIVT